MPEFRTSAYGTPCGATWALGTVWDRTGKIFKPWFRNWCSQPAARWGFSLSFRSVFKASGPRRPLILACLLVSVHAAILGGLAHSAWQSHLSELIQMAIDALCVLAAVEASRSSERFAGYFWRLAALSFSMLALAQSLSVSFAMLDRYNLIQPFTEILFLFWFGPLSLALFLSSDSEPRKFDPGIILDFTQALLFWFAVYFYFSYLLPQQSSQIDLIHAAWKRSLIYNAVVVGAFLLRAVLTKSTTMRSLFGRVGLFFLVSSLADLYYSYPGGTLNSGDWYDLVWSSLLLLPIVIATQWRNRAASVAERVQAQRQDLIGKHMFPLIYSLLVLTMCAQIAREHLTLAYVFVFTSFVCSSGRLFIMQRDQGRTEGALDLAENRYRAIVENAVEGIFQTTPEGRYITVNAALARMYGYGSPKELMSAVKDIGHEVYVDPSRRMRFKQAMREYGIVKDFEYQVYRKDGSKIWLSENARTVRDDNGAILFYEGTVQDISDRKRAQEELSYQEAQYHRLIENIPEIVWTADEQGRVVLISERIAEIFGYTPEEIRREGPHLWYGRMHADDRSRVQEAYAKLFSDNRPFDVEYRIQHRDGHWMRWHDRAVAIEHREGKRYADGLLSDITERSRLEEQFRQAQKMEAVGQLAGGVAHDFNNLLMIIQGHSDVMLECLEASEPRRKNVDEIQKAARRAASLTRQLLAFSRMQVLNPKVLDMNSAVAETGKMLRRLIGEDIELNIVPGSGLLNVRADQGQIEQVILNLAVNARDAMPRGGKLTIETSIVKVDADYSHEHLAMRPGTYVSLVVTDTGVGMDTQTQARIFEPFFTTKEMGKGTGLGLSTVYGIVKQSGGWIWVYSEPGQGTTFKVYLPQLNEQAQVGPREVQMAAPHGTETILLVEDQDSIRELAAESLARCGYTVLSASDGLEGLRMAERDSKKIHLLVTDLVMPKMGGRELADRLSVARPDMKTLFMSGYAEHRGSEHTNVALPSVSLQKPFSMNTLLHKVREVLLATVSVRN